METRPVYNLNINLLRQSAKKFIEEGSNHDDEDGEWIGEREGQAEGENGVHARAMIVTSRMEQRQRDHSMYSPPHFSK